MVLVIIYGGNIKQSYTHVGSPELRVLQLDTTKTKGTKGRKPKVLMAVIF